MLSQAPQFDSTRRDSVVNFIVRLRTSPTAKNAAGRASQAAQIRQEHQEFISKLNDLGGNARTSGDTKTIRVVREYKNSFNGFTLKANRSFSEAIKRMPYVISVTEDKKVKANDEVSNGVIKVPQVWNEVGATGQGVVIGIIDTGIDYQHPDLGGAIGSQHKVIGGYDFVNNDDDPLDDNGHGTHVAGIAAANGLLKGVAPNARLMAIKVLDANGSGWDSQILAGIEYAIDPDGNPATDDAPDVVNMSLGRSPDPSEPLSEAVNNAVLQGICFVIAAGNNYDYFQIGTPAIAEHAITVAATDNYDNTAWFSSRGPLLDSFILKPDVAAPGVSINSTFLSDYKRLDGTSMASPHVTGVAALILGKHPDWTPGDVKAAMMSTARMDGDDKFLETGAGIVDAYKAITTDIIMSPGSISYGRPQTTEGSWKSHDVITVSNKGQTSQSIQLELEGLTDEGAIDIQIAPSQFVLAAGATREVTINIDVNIGLLEKRNIPDGYYGTIALTSGATKLKTLLSLFNPAVTTLEFNSRVPSVVIIGGVGSSYWKPFFPNAQKFDVMLPAGTYDVLSYFGDSLVVVEDHEASTESTKIVVDSKAAKNRIDFKPVDANGSPLPLGAFGSTAMIGPTTVTSWFAPLETFYFSNAKKYKMYTRIFDSSSEPGKSYEIALSTGEEISSSKIVSNDPASFTQMTITNPSVPEGQTQGFFFHAVSSVFTTWNTFAVPLPNPVNILYFEEPSNITSSYYRFLPPAGSGGFTFETSMLNVSPEHGNEFTNYWGTSILSFDHEPFDFHLGRSLLNFTGSMANTPDHISISEGTPRGVFNHAFGERTSGVVSWSLKGDDQVIYTGTFRNNTSDDDFQPYMLFEQETSQGVYQFTMKWDSYYVGGRFSDVTTTLDFDTSENDHFDYSPPVINQYLLTSDGRVTNDLESGKGGTISIEVFDPYLSTTTLERKVHGTDAWTSLPLITSGDKKTATIPSDILPGLYSLRLKSTDIEGNSITHTLDPAFAVGEQPVTVPFTKVSLILPWNYDVNAGINPVFTWTNISSANYVFQISETDSFDELLAEQEVSVATYSLPTPLEREMIYYWRVKASVAGTELPWSKVFTFKASNLQAASLVSPVMGAVDVPISPTEFSWTPANMDSWQKLELSTNEDFSETIYSASMNPGTAEADLYFLMEGTRYYWRVKTSYFNFYNQYEILSDVFSFKTPKAHITDPPGGPGSPIVTGLEEDSNTLNSFPNPFSERAYIRLVAKREDVARISLFDQLGRQVRTSQYNLAKGENILTIEAESPDHRDASLTQGMYVALVQTGSQHTYRLKLVKK